MGVIQHHAIVVTGYYGGPIEEEHSRAWSMFEPGQVSALSAVMVNGYQSFCIFPDGSKEGWPASKRWDDARAKFLEGCKADYVEVSFGECGARLERTNCEDMNDG